MITQRLFGADKDEMATDFLHMAEGDIEMAATLLRHLLSSTTLDQALKEMSLMQKGFSDFWMAAHLHVQSGKTLSSFLEGKWNDTLVTPIKIGELSGDLQFVLAEIEQTLALKRRIKKAFGKLYYPVAMLLGGISAAIFSLMVVVPSLSTGLPKGPDGKSSNQSMVMSISETVTSFLTHNQYLVAGVLAALVLAAIWASQQKEVRNGFLRMVNALPYVGIASRELYFGLWARYIALMTKCGISTIDALAKGAPLLPDHLANATTLVLANASRGFANAVTIPESEPEDPRHNMPVFIINAFRLTDRVGLPEKHFAEASPALVDIGVKRIERFTEWANSICTIAAIVMAVSPMVVYFLQLQYIMQVMQR